MIDIELLPAEFRDRERTPPALFAASLAGVGLAASSVAYGAYVNFGTFARVRAEQAALEEEQAGLAPSVAYHDALEAEKAEVERRLLQLRDISATRIPWAKKLDQVASIVNVREEEGRYLVWFEELSIEQATEERGGGGVFELKTLSGSDNFADGASFFEDLEKPEFFGDFEGVNIPTGKRSDPDPKQVPSQVWEFPVRFQLKKLPPRKPPIPSVPPPPRAGTR